MGARPLEVGPTVIGIRNERVLHRGLIDCPCGIIGSECTFFCVEESSEGWI